MLKLEEIIEMNINWVDLIISGLFIYGSILGFKRGLIRELASFLGLFISLTSVYYFSENLSNLINLLLGLSNTVSYIISCLLIFFTSIYLISRIAIIITKTLNITILGYLNRVFGLTFGFLKWVIIVSSIILILNKIFFLDEISNQLRPNQTETSFMYKPLTEVGELLFQMFNSSDVKEEWKIL